MTIGIIVAMTSELNLLLHQLDNPGTTTVCSREYHLGHIGNHRIVVGQCGIGKVNAAVGALTMIEHFSPDIIINTGVAGGTTALTRPLDVVVATGIRYHDIWCGPGTEEGTVQDLPPVFVTDSRILAMPCLASGTKTHHGLIASGDMFISNVEQVQHIHRVCPGAIACDMESGAIAQTCHLRDIPFACIRVISDTPGQADNISQYENFWCDAPRRTFELLTRVIAAL